MLAGYETLLGLSREMERLALAEEWDALGTLQSRRAVLLASLPEDIEALPPAERVELATTIRQILACDEKTREYAAQWQKPVGTLLARLGVAVTD